MKAYFNDGETTKGDRNQQIKERADRVRDVGQKEARDGVAISTEDDISFFKG